MQLMFNSRLFSIENFCSMPLFDLQPDVSRKVRLNLQVSVNNTRLKLHISKSKWQHYSEVYIRSLSTKESSCFPKPGFLQLHFVCVKLSFWQFLLLILSQKSLNKTVTRPGQLQVITCNRSNGCPNYQCFESFLRVNADFITVQFFIWTLCRIWKTMRYPVCFKPVF